MLIQSLLLIVGGYLLGSVSSTYLIGRWLGGKDLRQYGSGSLSGSMVYEHVGRWAIVPVVLFDGLKGTDPASGAVPATFPLLRTLQLAANAQDTVSDPHHRVIPYSASPEGSNVVAMPIRR